MKIEFIGKSLLIETGKERILAIGDLHLGYGEGLRRSGVHIPSKTFEFIEKEIEAILNKVGKVDEVILLGDVKHSFSTIMRDEREEIRKLFLLIKKKAKKIIIIKGNHDKILEPIVRNYFIEIKDFYLKESICFLHGDRDFKEIYNRKIKLWVMGHAHPAIELSDGVKRETYKCFLEGKWKGKKIIVLPSFFSVNEGSNICLYDLNLAWNFKIESFKAHIVGEGLEVLPFGKVKNLCNN